MFDTLFANGGLTATGVLAAIGIGLILLVVLVIRLGRRGRRHHGGAGGHRLAVLDQVPIDETRRLVLIQRDDVQHLVILGGGSDFLVEAGIGRAPARQAVPAEPIAERAPAVAKATPRAAAPVRDAAPAPAPAAAPAAPAVPVTPATIVPKPVAAAPAVAAAAVAPPPPPPRSAEPPAAPVPVFDATETEAETAPAADARPTSPSLAEEPRTPGTGRVAVKLDPHFAGMVDQLEATLRRPAAPEPAARPAPPVGPAEPAAEVARTQAPPVQPAQRPSVVDADFENEMANLLGRTRRPQDGQ
ncbi:flagellar biosynthetic protein FliO [Ancylobacter oerskovii]|uniref:Flagellar biosynthetic protein FliO n=1 Tax=Ancylobacter oerskovii TaxID=459519 RepID=A0ABW4Z379_9HYPH|nr:flagellar biosynthetic protein FliO [Ancylobacter oerskovii]MBS7546078.1 flagellar biosynthetic protein FliO [Ancylobacter oerskovii]